MVSGFLDAPPSAAGATSFRAAAVADAERLAAFGARAFHDTFAADNRAEDMTAYLSASFSPERQLAELADARTTTLLAERDGAIAGYAQLRAGTSPAAPALDAPVELVRFYVDRRLIGGGLAGPLMRRALDAARRCGGATIWLGVWERNPRAIAFYRKCGFADIGTQRFMLGADVQTDRIMARPLSDADLLREPAGGARAPEAGGAPVHHTGREHGMHDRERWVRETYAAIDRKDNDAFIGRFAPDVHVRFGNADPVVGREANRAAFRRFFDAIRAIRHHIDHAYYVGDTIVLEFTVTYTRLDGREVTVPAAAVWELERDLATRFQVYVDQSPLWAEEGA